MAVKIKTVVFMVTTLCGFAGRYNCCPVWSVGNYVYSVMTQKTMSVSHTTEYIVMNTACKFHLS